MQTCSFKAQAAQITEVLNINIHQPSISSYIFIFFQVSCESLLQSSSFHRLALHWHLCPPCKLYPKQDQQSKLFTPGCDGGQVAKNAKRELQFSNSLNFRCWVPASLTPTTKSTSTKHWQYRFSTALQLWPKLLLLASLNRGLLVGWRLWTTATFTTNECPTLVRVPSRLSLKRPKSCWTAKQRAGIGERRSCRAVLVVQCYNTLRSYGFMGYQWQKEHSCTWRELQQVPPLASTLNTISLSAIYQYFLFSMDTSAHATASEDLYSDSTWAELCARQPLIVI